MSSPLVPATESSGTERASNHTYCLFYISRWVMFLFLIHTWVKHKCGGRVLRLCSMSRCVALVMSHPCMIITPLRFSVCVSFSWSSGFAYIIYIYFLLCAVIGSLLDFILMRCPNHFICCLLMNLMPLFFLMSSFHILSVLDTKKLSFAFHIV